MFLLDTNVVSELMRHSPDAAVRSWLRRQPDDSFFFSTVGEAELRYGASLLPTGRRKVALNLQIEEVLRDSFADKVLAFDRAAARAFGDVAVSYRSTGRQIVFPDCQIAAIAISRRMAVVTRNIRDFVDTGVELVNPWTDSE